MSKQHSTCRNNRSTCGIRQCCFDIVPGVDRALVQPTYWITINDKATYKSLFSRLFLSFQTVMITIGFSTPLARYCYTCHRFHPERFPLQLTFLSLALRVCFCALCFPRSCEYQLTSTTSFQRPGIPAHSVYGRFL